MLRVLGGFVGLAIAWLLTAGLVPTRYKDNVIWGLFGYVICMVWTFVLSEHAKKLEEKGRLRREREEFLDQERNRVNALDASEAREIQETYLRNAAYVKDSTLRNIFGAIRDALALNRPEVEMLVDTQKWGQHNIWAELTKRGYIIQFKHDDVEGMDDDGYTKREIIIKWSDGVSTSVEDAPFPAELKPAM